MYSRKKIPDHFLRKPDFSLSEPQKEPLPSDETVETTEKKRPPSSDVHRFPVETLLLLHFFSEKKTP